jgi:signal transduction histidine kinase
MAALGRIVAGVAHELRTPIGNVRTVVSALSEDIKAFRKSIPDDPDASPDRASLDEFVETLETGSRIAERNVERAVDLVRHFRQTAVDQNNEQRRKFDMGAVISELLATLRPQYAKRGVTLKTDFAGPVMVENFSSVIDQLVLSLVNNAMTHAFDAETGGTIIVRARSLPNDNVLLEVADDGKGIPKDIQSMIFEPFWTTRRGSGGTGMGLSIVVSIVNRVLAGEIDVISTPGKGATFRVIMPARAPNESSVKSSIFEADVTASGGSFDGS